MSLRFIYGRSGCGKSSFCLENIKWKIDRGVDYPLVFLVPEQFSFQAGKNLLEKIGEEGMMKASVLSFKRMAFSVFSEVGGLGRKHMNPAGRAMLLYSIMEDLKNYLKFFTRAARYQGFTDTVSDIITEFKRYSVTPDVLTMVKDNIQDDALKNKLDDIQLIYTAFESELHEKYIDAEDDLTMLAEKLDSCSIFNGAEIYIDEFSSFTPQEYIVIGKLMKKCRRINITLCMDIDESGKVDGDGVFASLQNTEKRLLSLAEEMNIMVDKPIILKNDVCKRFEDSRELNHIEKNFFEFPYKRFQGNPKNIRVFKSVNRFSEIEHIARDITSLVRDEGLRYRDIAVLTRDIKAYENLFEAVFTEYDIPYFIDRKRDISSNPLIVMILSALEIIQKSWPYESVFRYLKTGFSGIEGFDIDLIENYVLAAGIRGKKWTDGEAWSYRINYDFANGEISPVEKEILDRVNEIKKSIVRPIVNLEKKLKGKVNAFDIASGIYEFLMEINAGEKIQELIDEFKNQGELDTANEYSRIWNTLMEVLDQIVEVMKDTEMSLERFIKVFNIGLREEEVGLIPPSLDQVIIGSADRIRTHGVVALYIAGVNDGIFPMIGNDEGLLSDRDRENLREIGLELAQDTRAKAFEEQYIIYRTITTPSKYLNISYPIADHEGRTLRPSIIVSRLKKVFPDLIEESNVVISDDDYETIKAVSMPGATFKELVFSMRRYMERTRVNPIWRDVYRWYIKNDDWKEKCQRAISGLLYTNMVQNVDEDSIRRLYGKHIRSSVSRLEKYSACPFAYFIQYGLKAKERKVYELSPPDIGSFIHAVLDKFAEKLDKDGVKWRDVDIEYCEKTVSRLVEEVLEGNPSILKSSPRYMYIVKKLKDMVIKTILVMAVQIRKGSFNPRGHEMSFGEGGDYPPISVELPSGDKVELIGRIDRMDTTELDGDVLFRIIDYKTGNKEFSLSDVYNGIEMQLIVYLDAVVEYAEKNGLNAVPGGVLYFKIDDPVIKSDGDMEDEDVKGEILKKLKMKGLVISDIKIIKEMDKDVESTSIVIPVGIKKDGNLTATSSAASMEEFELLRKHVKGLIVKYCGDMLSGVIEIKPYKKSKKSPCEYCGYHPVCKFDTTMKDNTCRAITDLKKDEIFKRLKEEKEGVKENGGN